MKITGTALATLGVAFNAAFKEGLGLVADTDISDIAMTVPSSTGTEEYGWLGELPDMREWVGDRVVNQLQAAGYSIRNKDWEQTVGVKRNDIEDDNVGMYSVRFRAMGRSTASHPPKLSWGLLKNGFATKCYDGQYFFDTDHPVLDAAGAAQSVANFVDGAYAPWYLIDTAHEMKPLIFQNRKSAEFASLDKPTDEPVFRRKEFQYGVDARYNVGFGLWQLCYASKADLTPDNFGTLFGMMEGQKGDYDRPLGTMPKLLIAPPVHRKKAMQIVNAMNDAAGSSNVWQGSVELKVVPWLA